MREVMHTCGSEDGGCYEYVGNFPYYVEGIRCLVRNKKTNRQEKDISDLATSDEDVRTR